eukprot:TRINITY_DN5609_c1_g1_i1.p1 TRINITY_DN5609_c1_g1~~TRINITY_DN5609_c1_g1_i1.p1  ORF type:complete len:246 (+),score=54.91 TRINITY_DN5609_c1_g1_i1:18-755(+)
MSQSKKVKIPHVDTSGDTIRIVVVSDTHNRHQRISVPDGDVLIHCGDFTHKSNWKSGQGWDKVESTNEWLGTLMHEHKLVISGNHEIGFNDKEIEEIQDILSNATYVQDNTVSLYGLNFYGSPWTGSRRMAFSANRNERKEIWDNIPRSTDILFTHMPPEYILDLAWTNKSQEFCERCKKDHKNYSHWGCPYLKRRVRKVNPVVHIFGHVHDCPGSETIGETTYINAAMDESDTVLYFDVPVRSE